MRRTGTGESSKSAKARSLRRRTTDPFKTQARKQADDGPTVYQGRYGIYNKLTWEKLKEFLERKFDGYRFEKEQVCIVVPSPLQKICAHVAVRSVTTGSLKHLSPSQR